MTEGVVREASRLFGRSIRENEPLSKHCSFRIGGPARLFLAAQRLKALREALVFCRENSLPFFVLGKGTNVLIPDTGFEGIVIGVQARKLQVTGESVIAEAGAALPKLARTAAERGLAGLEFSAGIPGSVGGAAIMNAGAHGEWIGPLIQEVWAFDLAGREAHFPSENLHFGYRESSLNDFPGIVARVAMRLRQDKQQEIERRMEQFLAIRGNTQPSGARCAGSVFKNPPGDSAGRLIELARCKGLSQGGAAVSQKHANFIINRGGATYADVKGLIEALKEKVRKVHEVELELEIIDLGEESRRAS